MYNGPPSSRLDFDFEHRRGVQFSQLREFEEEPQSLNSIDTLGVLSQADTIKLL